MQHYDATVLGIPFDGGTTYRSGTRFGPQGVRKISALYNPYNYEMAVDLREQMTLWRCGRRVHHPCEYREKRFDQISPRCVACRVLGLAPDHDWRGSFYRVSVCARHCGVHIQEDRHRAF